ncbi:MAG TPA: serine hydrolase domain-containing protein [Sphingomicrobium sp.]
MTGPGAAETPPPPAFTAALEAMVRDDGAPGVAALVMRDGQLLYRAKAGRIDPDQPLPVASSSKWVAAALIMTLVDDGLLSLDEPVGKYLPGISGEAARVTLRQLLSFTSGQGGLKGFSDLRQPPDISLAESARRIASVPLTNRPGSVFEYGSGALQIAGALAEQASGKRWSELFAERIAKPLGMASSHWTHPLHLEVDPARVTNPNLQGGLVTTAADYGRFLGMIAGGGSLGGKPILSVRAIDEMERLQTAGLKLLVPRQSAHKQMAGYALGNWCEQVERSGRCSLVSSPGALGTYPWVDRKSGVYGVFVMRHRYPRVAGSLDQARDAAIAAAGRATPPPLTPEQRVD